MTSTEIMKVIEEEISEHLSFNIKQLTDDNLVLQLRYKDKSIGQEYEIKAGLGYYTDHGHGGETYADRVKLDINKLR